MRRLLVLALALASCVTACTSEDPAPLFVGTDYQVRCVGCQPQAADDPARRVEAIDGEHGFTIECNVNERGGEQVVTFSARYTDAENASRNYSIALNQINLDGDPGSSCRVVVTEGANTYEGHCTTGEPSADEPCSVQISAEDGVVSGSILCHEIPNRGAAMVTRHVVDPGSEDPAEFEVHGCVGL